MSNAQPQTPAAPAPELTLAQKIGMAQDAVNAAVGEVEKRVAAHSRTVEALKSANTVLRSAEEAFGLAEQEVARTNKAMTDAGTTLEEEISTPNDPAATDPGLNAAKHAAQAAARAAKAQRDDAEEALQKAQKKAEAAQDNLDKADEALRAARTKRDDADRVLAELQRQQRNGQAKKWLAIVGSLAVAALLIMLCGSVGQYLSGMSGGGDPADQARAEIPPTPTPNPTPPIPAPPAPTPNPVPAPAPTETPVACDSTWQALSTRDNEGTHTYLTYPVTVGSDGATVYIADGGMTVTTGTTRECKLKGGKVITEQMLGKVKEAFATKYEGKAPPANGMITTEVTLDGDEVEVRCLFGASPMTVCFPPSPS